MKRRSGLALALIAFAVLAVPLRAQTPDVAAPALLFRSGTGYTHVPLQRTEVEIDVRGLVAASTVTQVYVNDSDTAVEALYVFPLPSEAAVYEMEMRVGDRLIRSVVKEREQARQTYEAARSQGQRAALVEQERPNVFTTSLANLMPGDRVEVRLRYVEPLAWQDGRLRLVFPMVVGPRYVPARGVTDAAAITPPVREPGTRPGHDVTLRVRADLGVPIAAVSSPSHEIEVGRESEAVAVSLARRTTLPNRDFVLEMAAAAGAAPQAALFLSPDPAGSETHFMLVAYPPAPESLAERPPLELVFLIDVSGSMAGTSIEQARAALLQGLDRLRPGDSFNVVAYESAFTSFRAASIEASAEGLEQGRRFVSRLQANGGTELLPALRHVLATPASEGRLRYVVLLTDGCLGNEDEVFSALEQGLGSSRLFTVAIGSAPNHHLATRMAQYGRGSFTHIAEASDVAAQMGRLLDQIDSPVLTELRLEWDGVSADQVFPARLPDLFLRQPLVVHGRLDGFARGRARLRGLAAGAAFAEDFTVSADQAQFHPGITTVWARQVVAEQMDAWRRAGSEEERETVRAGIVAHAVRHHLVTRFTSLVAVEEVVANVEGTLRQARVPTELPHGWQMEAVFGANPVGGTADLFLEALGAALLTAGLALALMARRRRGLAAIGART